MNRRKKIIWILAAMLVLFSSCRTKRYVIKEPIKEEGPEYLFKQLKNNEVKYLNLSAKFNASYTVQRNTTSIKGQLRIRKDSLIWLSISPALGIEMARVLISNDSIKVLTRLQKKYFITEYAYIYQVLNSILDFDMLQAFITGNDFSFYEKGSFKASIDGDDYRLSTAHRHKLKKYVKENEEVYNIPIQQMWLNPETFKINKTQVKEIEFEGRKIEAIYSDFIQLEDQLFPQKIAFSVKAEDKIELLIEYSKVKIDTELSFPFSIPGSYEKMEFDQ